MYQRNNYSLPKAYLPKPYSRDDSYGIEIKTGGYE